MNLTNRSTYSSLDFKYNIFRDRHSFRYGNAKTCTTFLRPFSKFLFTAFPDFRGNGFRGNGFRLMTNLNVDVVLGDRNRAG
jgi:hypothetical protein